jgi:hypothetical protein
MKERENKAVLPPDTVGQCLRELLLPSLAISPTFSWKGRPNTIPGNTTKLRGQREHGGEGPCSQLKTDLGITAS